MLEMPVLGAKSLLSLQGGHAVGQRFSQSLGRVLWEQGHGRLCSEAAVRDKSSNAVLGEGGG